MKRNKEKKTNSQEPPQQMNQCYGQLNIKALSLSLKKIRIFQMFPKLEIRKSLSQQKTKTSQNNRKKQAK